MHFRCVRSFGCLTLTSPNPNPNPSPSPNPNPNPNPNPIPNPNPKPNPNPNPNPNQIFPAFPVPPLCPPSAFIARVPPTLTFTTRFPRMLPIPPPLVLFDARHAAAKGASALSPPPPGPVPEPAGSHDPAREAYVRSLAVAKIGSFLSLDAANSGGGAGQEGFSINGKMSLKDLLQLFALLGEAVRDGMQRHEVALQSRHLLELLKGKLIEVHATELVLRYMIDNAEKTA